MTIGDAIKLATSCLRKEGISNPEKEGQFLLEEVLGVSGTNYLNYSQLLATEEALSFWQKLKLRLKRVPVQYITGRQAFRYLDLKLTPGVFIPRPETELLVQYLLEEAQKMPVPPKAGAAPITFLDLGTGSGAIAISLAFELPQAFGYATDISSEALKVAFKNARAYNLEKKITFIHSDLFENLDKDLHQKIDIIVSNPPYISHFEIPFLSKEVHFEPFCAIDGGEDGLEIYPRIVNGSFHFLRSGGLLALEVGEGQAQAVSNLIAKSGKFAKAQIFADYAGIDRIVLATRS